MNTIPKIHSEERKFARSRNMEETCLGLAGDLLDRALHVEIEEANLLLVQITDTQLLGFTKRHHDHVAKLANRATELVEDLSECFVRSSRASGRPHFLREKSVITIEEQIDMFRQEIFWTSPSELDKRPDEDRLQRAEELIFRVYSLYRSIEAARHLVDSARKDGLPSHRHSAPELNGNRYLAGHQVICAV